MVRWNLAFHHEGVVRKGQHKTSRDREVKGGGHFVTVISWLRYLVGFLFLSVQSLRNPEQQYFCHS